ncbi:hypothetical protein GCM10010435_36470 [Winogradskya consettensis]|uniref:PPE family domain-containing protein n=1 Tax=Winogradskya consettensis TaxID=113560 RepID=A0A919VZD8_9ACTN|nr:hypothetical protein [Actinoplanes consettensis]GIM81678.1 hypothetical protein Aco04nite_77780 [Actinoplanes consettensis]
MPPAPWESYTLPDIWKMLRHESTCDGADRILDWDALTHDVRTQHRRLKEAREELAAAWPPDKNTSARTFLDHIDILTTAMQQTLTRAEDTRAGLRGIIEAISEAQLTVQPLIEQRATITNDLIPRWADHAEDEYDAQAQQAMKKAELAIADHTAQLQPPELFFMRTDRAVTGTEVGGNSPGREISTGPTGSSGTSISDSLRATPIPVPVPHDPPPATIGQDGSSSIDGPGLSGAVTPIAPIEGVLGPPISSGGGISGGGALPGSVVGGGPFGFPGAVPGNLTVPPRRQPSPTGRHSLPVKKALPSGAVIGSANAATGTSGLIGQPHPPRSDRKQRGTEAAIQGKTDQTWDVLEGVVPVIRPRRRRHEHGPGPGVIGYDR